MAAAIPMPLMIDAHIAMRHILMPMLIYAVLPRRRHAMILFRH